jgi:hypothetical protein
MVTRRVSEARMVTRRVSEARMVTRRVSEARPFASPPSREGRGEADRTQPAAHDVRKSIDERSTRKHRSIVP